MNLIQVRPMLTNTQEIEETLELMKETRTKISILIEIRIMIYKKRFEKKYMLICLQNLLKNAIDVKTLFNPEVEKYVQITNPTMFNNLNAQPQAIGNTPPINPLNLNKLMNLIV